VIRTLIFLSLMMILCAGAAPWAETAARIRQQKAQAPSREVAAATTQKSTVLDPRVALSRRVARISYDNVALSDVIDAFRDMAGANIHVNWKALETIGVDKNAPVTIHLNNVSLRKVLQTVLKDLGGTENLVTYFVDDGVIEVTTREISDRQLITRVYPVGDLLMEVPNFAGPNVQLSNVGQGGGGRGGGGGGSSMLSDSNSNDNSTQQQPKTKQEAATDLVTLIKETVSPDVWRENGGTASAAFFNGHLVVTAPRSVHEQLGSESD
jgi:hypothetical protein